MAELDRFLCAVENRRPDRIVQIFGGLKEPHTSLSGWKLSAGKLWGLQRSELTNFALSAGKDSRERARQNLVEQKLPTAESESRHRGVVQGVQEVCHLPKQLICQSGLTLSYGQSTYKANYIVLSTI